MGKRIAVLMMFIWGVTLAGVSVADGKTEATYRQGVMKAIGGHMTGLATIMKNQVHQEDLALHARGIAALSDVAPNVFPAGSDVEKSKSLPAIWENPDAFSAAMAEFGVAAKAFAVAAETGDMAQIGPAMGELGGACKGCHDDFKAE